MLVPSLAIFWLIYSIWVFRTLGESVGLLLRAQTLGLELYLRLLQRRC
jgi:predicted branched-subunit amino acid permease